MRAAHASTSVHRASTSTRTASGKSSVASSLHPDIDDGGQGGETDPLLDPERNNENRQNNLPQRCQVEAIFPLLHVIRQDVRSTIDTHLDWNELTSLDLNCTFARDD